MALLRRHFLLSTLSTVTAACTASKPPAPSATPTEGGRSIADIEATAGGRLGFFALDTGSGRRLGHRPDERFAMCSTFKWVLAAAVLERVDRRMLRLDDPIPYSEADLLEYAPATRKHIAEGSMTVAALAEAAITVSDNTAANLLLARVGGPSGLTQFMRAVGDAVTRLDRVEPALNTNEPGDPRDTTSPRAMVELMRRILIGEVLSPAGRERLVHWLRATETGKNRLRAGLPHDWVVGNKTGSGARNAINDLAIAVPPGRAPVLVAVYMSGSTRDLSSLEAVHAELGKLASRRL